MTVLVTGAAGHIGANLVRTLVEQGLPVRALVHTDHVALDGLNIESVQGDTGDLVSLGKAFMGADVVYHLASYVSIQPDEWPLMERINITGTWNVISACLTCGVRRLIHFSSIEAYQKEPLADELDEDRPLVTKDNCHSAYSLSKGDSERLVREASARGLDVVIINPAAVVGPYDFKPSHIGQVLLAIAGHRLPALVGGGFNWVDARDVVLGALQASAHAPPGSRYLLPGHWVSVRQLAAIVSRLTGESAPRLVFPLALAKLGAPLLASMSHLAGKRPLFTAASLEALNSSRHVSQARAERDLFYHPRPFEQTIADTLQWFIESGQLKLNRTMNPWKRL
jgi:dihydroflavonol-4-reductase